jgi:hypothetical protein
MHPIQLDRDILVHDGVVATSGPPLVLFTRSPTVEAFIASFGRLVTEHHLLLPLRSARPLGAVLRFSIQLADRRVVFQGVGRVVDTESPRPGRSARVRLSIIVLDKESQTMHLCLLMASKPRPTDPHDAKALAADLQKRMRDTVPMPSELLKQLTRPPLAPPEPPSSVPANPFEELSSEAVDAFVESRLGELGAIADTPVATRRVSATRSPPLVPRPRPRPRLPVRGIVAMSLLTGAIGTIAGYLLWG